MERSQQIAEVVAASRELLKNGRKDDLALTLLEQAVHLLYSHPDYINHQKLRLDSNFAYLPNEIVHDVVESVAREKIKSLETDNSELDKSFANLALLSGSWKEAGNEFATANWDLRCTHIRLETEVSRLAAKASKLYECINVLDPPAQLYGMLELMGTRFSKIAWATTPAGLSEAAVLQFGNFVKRQLRSKYLWSLSIRGVKIEGLTTNPLLVEFVKKPQFKELKVVESSTLPFQVFEEAHKNWLAAERFSVQRKWVIGAISHESCRKLEQCVKDHQRSSKNSKHPVHKSAKMNLALTVNLADVAVKMAFYDLVDKSEFRYKR